MTQPAIYLEHDGKPTPVSDLVWGQFASCGCLSGASTIDQRRDGEGGEVHLTIEALIASFQDPKAVTDRHMEDGFTWRIITWDEYRAHTMRCEHTPRWGVTKVDAPDGHVWATTDRWHAGRRTHKRHIVRAEDIDVWSEKRTAACGHRPSRGASPWNTEDANISDTVTCRKCEKTVSP